MFENELDQASNKFKSLETDHAIIEFVNNVRAFRPISKREIYLRLMTTMYINKGNYSEEVFSILSDYYEKDIALADCLMDDYQAVIEYSLYSMVDYQYYLSLLSSDLDFMCYALMDNDEMSHTFYNAFGYISASLSNSVNPYYYIEEHDKTSWAVLQIYLDSIGQKAESHLVGANSNMALSDGRYDNALIISIERNHHTYKKYLDQIFGKIKDGGTLMLIIQEEWLLNVRKDFPEHMIAAIDTVIELPEKRSCILIFSKKKNDKVKFVYSAQSDSFEKDDVEYVVMLKSILENNPEICRIVNKEDINWSRSIRPSHFFKELSGIKNPVRLGDIIEPFEDILLDAGNYDGGPIWQVDQLSDNWLFSEVKMTNVREFGRIFQVSRSALYLMEYHNRLLMGHSTGILLDYVTVQEGIEPFFVKDESKVSIEYILYSLSQPYVSKQVKSMYRTPHTGKIPLSEYLDLVISLPETKEEQEKELMQAKTALFEQKGFLQHSADMAHMLSTPMTKIGVELELLSFSDSLSEADKRCVQSARSILSYMNRLLSQNSGDLFSERKKSPVCLPQFIQEYVDGWSHFGSNTFRVEVDIAAEAKDCVVLANRDSLSILFDCLFDNANRHGFRKKADPANLLEVDVTNISYDQTDYLKVEVRNNGHMMDPGFTLSDYIARGRFSAESGRSGLGGHHVNKIIESMQGHLLSVGSASGKTFIVFIVPLLKE